MKLKEGENFESWSRRVEMYEKGIAMQRIAQGEDVLKVIEDMSHRITQKLMHPIFKMLHEPKIPFDIENHRKDYEKALNGKKSSADHIERNS